jgi:YggT family protein
MAFAFVSTILWVVDTIIDLYIYVVIAAVIASWLIAFGVVNMRNEAVRTIMRVLDALTDPVFRQVRKIIPPFGGLDLSPLVVIIALEAIRYFLGTAFANIYYGTGL